MSSHIVRGISVILIELYRIDPVYHMRGSQKQNIQLICRVKKIRIFLVTGFSLHYPDRSTDYCSQYQKKQNTSDYLSNPVPEFILFVLHAFTSHFGSPSELIINETGRIISGSPYPADQNYQNCPDTDQEAQPDSLFQNPFCDSDFPVITDIRPDQE